MAELRQRKPAQERGKLSTSSAQIQADARATKPQRTIQDSSVLTLAGPLVVLFQVALVRASLPVRRFLPLWSARSVQPTLIGS